MQILDDDRTMLSPSNADVAQPQAYFELDFTALGKHGIIAADDDQFERVQEFRRIKRQILHNVENQTTDDQLPKNIVFVTSSVAGEGKTFIAANLALSLATEMDHRVLLIDGDAMKQDLSRILGTQNLPGFVDTLANGGSNVSGCILRTNVERLDLLPCGSVVEHLDELYASSLMQELITKLAEQDRQRIVVIDGPPLVPTTEAAVLARLMGQTLMVVEADKTPRRTVENALASLENCQHLSLLLNKTLESAFAG